MFDEKYYENSGEVKTDKCLNTLVRLLARSVAKEQIEKQVNINEQEK